jgi:cytochrome c oxidase subunit I
MVISDAYVFSGKVIFAYEVVAASIVAIAFNGFGVWARHSFAVGMSRTVDVYLQEALAE